MTLDTSIARSPICNPRPRANHTFGVGFRERHRHMTTPHPRPYMGRKAASDALRTMFSNYPQPKTQVARTPPHHRREIWSSLGGSHGRD